MWKDPEYAKHDGFIKSSLDPMVALPIIYNLCLQSSYNLVRNYAQELN